MYKDPEKQRLFQRMWKRDERLRHKVQAVKLLGGKCRRCGYDKNMAALQIDHKIPLKRKTRREMQKNQSTLLVRGVIKKKDVQLLCANCHAIKTYEEDRQTFEHFMGD